MNDTTKIYELLRPEPEENLLFSPLRGESRERHGAIGRLKISFDKYGIYPNERWTTYQGHLNTLDFNRECSVVLAFSYGNVFSRATDFAAYQFTQSVNELMNQDGLGVKVITENYSFYVRCQTHDFGKDAIFYAYDNRFLLPELAGQHELPKECYSILPSTGELIIISRGKRSYAPCDASKPNPEENRLFADTSNRMFGITRGQEEAMLCGSLFGWDKPAARPWRYDAQGRPRSAPPPNKDAPER